MDIPVDSPPASLRSRVAAALACADQAPVEIAKKHQGHETVVVTTWQNVPMDRW